MKLIKRLFFLVLLLGLFFPMTSFSHDTDLYMASGEGVEPNILIIFDNSGSMNDQVQTRYYDPTITYDPLVVPVGNRDTVYYRTSRGAWNFFANSISDVACPSARTALTNYGNYAGNTNASCSSSRQTLRTGNYRNYVASGGDQFERKLDIAKRVIRDFLNTINGVRMGVMVFNRSVTDYSAEGGPSRTNSHGGRIQSTIKSLTDANRTQLKNDIDAIVAETWTPLAETLYEAGLYFKGGASRFNPGVNYISPIQYYCQRNYILLITDGDSTRDQNSILGTAIGDRDGDGREPGGANEVYYIVDGENMLGTDYLDDVAKYLYDTDLRSDLTGSQNIITYTIGFTYQSQNGLLDRTATQGHGRYFYTENAQQLSDAFQNIVGEILEKTSSFVAPIVPVSRMERTTAGDKIYLAFFQPNKDEMWSGNIKKFGVVQSGANIGQIIDVNGLPALDDNGQILPTALSFWTTTIMDGSDVEKGGIGEILMNRSSARNIYTYLGSNVNLSDPSNVFNTTNITPTLLGITAGDTLGRNKLVQFVLGYDAYDDNGNGNTTEKRDWILGAFLHSRPFIIHYASRSVIFAGSNDGMLHAFDDETGEELWGFIPPNLLNKLQALRADVIESFVDGSPKAYIARNTDGSINRVILIFGERRGGDHYYALDVTNPVAPQYLWKISPDMADYTELGQTWSTPSIGKITYGAGEKWVAFIGGGYDTNEDNDNPNSSLNSKGRAIYVVDMLTGSLVRRFSVSDPGYSTMTYSIPTDTTAKIDMNGDGKIDRLYVGDMGGRIWRFDIGDPNPSNWTGKIIFQSNPGRDGTTGRKIFYPPEVTLEYDGGNYEMLFFGTGDREHPKGASTVDRLYALKDRNPSSPLTENLADGLVDVTQDLLQDPTYTGDKSAIRNSLRTGNGWFILLVNSGEKSLSLPIVFNKNAYFATFSPTAEGAGGDPCYVGEGTARVYIVEYTTGNAVFNLDLTNDLGGPVISKTDRSEVIGTGVPSGVIVTFISGQAVGYIGVGGGVDRPPVTGRQYEQRYWRLVF
jgi:type IV pilus assembly protein PilY1